MELDHVREIGAPDRSGHLRSLEQQLDVLLPEDEVEVSLRSEALAQALAALSERERKVLILRYGLDDADPKTLEEIGRRLGLTRERVRQIENDALRRLARLREMESVAG